MTHEMTYHEFLDWADEDTQVEWVNGKVVMTSPASLRQQLIAQFLGRVLAGYVEIDRLGIVVSAPFQMKLEQSGREPDVFFLAEAHRGRRRATYLDGPADLVIEKFFRPKASDGIAARSSMSTSARRFQNTGLLMTRRSERSSINLTRAAAINW